MGRRAEWFVVVCAISLSVPVLPTATAAAETGGVGERAGKKLVRGVINLGTGWTEMLKQPYLIGKRDGWLAGTLRGPIEGVGMVVARTVGGAYEILTFPLPIPPGYRPMVEPDYVWQDEAEASRPRSDAEAAGGGFARGQPCERSDRMVDCATSPL